MTVPARKPIHQVMAYIGREIDALDAGWCTPWPFGCLPGGASPSAVSLLFTTPLVTQTGQPAQVRIGTAANPSQWYVGNVPGDGSSARIDAVIPQANCRPLSKDIEAFITITTVSGQRPNSGHLIAWMTFIPHSLMRDSLSPWS